MSRPILAATIAISLFHATATPAQQRVIYSFGASSTDGIKPHGGLVMDKSGNVFGVTSAGGTHGISEDGYGTIFELTPAGNGGWSEKVLHSFGGGTADGRIPAAHLALDNEGNLYGTTNSGGAYDAGTVFELSPQPSGRWKERVLYSFGGAAADAETPKTGVIVDDKGNLYGASTEGGAYSKGAVFELIPMARGAWTEKLLFSFGASSAAAAKPNAGLIFDANGNLYSTTAGGGSHGKGVVYELTPDITSDAKGRWTERDIYNFSASAADGKSPIAGLAFGPNGNLYGTTLDGGANGNLGSVFELSPAANGDWTRKELYSFGADSSDGTHPNSGIVFDAAGNLYGTTLSGGDSEGGTVFRLTPEAGGGRTKREVHNFAAADGDVDRLDSERMGTGLLVTPSGAIFGTTVQGGTHDKGTAFIVEAVTVATPKFSLAAGIYPTSRPVTITSATAGATIYYTTNGAAPTKLSTKYTKAIPVAVSETIKAIAVVTGDTNSAVATAVYEIGTPASAPLFSVKAGTYATVQTVTITDATKGASIYYTLTGAAPTVSSTKYTTPIKASKSETIEAIAVAKGLLNSKVTTEAYLIETASVTPVFSVRAGTYAAPQTVKITDATAGSTIYYTINGKTPTTASAKYTSAIKVSASETLEAIAVAKGFLESKVAMAAYKIGKVAATPVLTAKPDSVMTTDQSVTITDATPGSTIYYTTNGKAPTTSSTKYIKPIPIDATETIEAVAIANGYGLSAVASAHYTFGPLNLDYAALPGGTDGGLSLTVGSSGDITVVPKNETDQPLTGITVTASTGSVKLPLTMVMCFEAVVGADGSCPSGSSTSLSYPSIPPGENSSKLVVVSVSSTGVIASSPANKITVSFKNSTGTLLASAVVPVTSIVQQVGVFIATASGSSLAIPVGGSSAFAVAAELNTAKAMSSVTMSTSFTPGNLPISITICQTDPQTAQCLTAPSPTVNIASFSPGSAGSLSFSVFVTASAAIANLPSNEITVLFKDSSGGALGSASVPVYTTN